jgi:NAD(P)H-flavin reductase
MAKVLDRRRIVPNVHLLEVHAPEVARRCRPGQFLILMVDERGERIPLSIADWDRERGTVTVIFLLVGTSTHKLARLRPGDEIPVFVGPLGRPSELGPFGTVVLAGGCFGIGALWPLARALKEAGKMCGARRCTAAGKTKFACVDGPEFDGHTLDWDELFLRRKAYFDDEIASLCAWEKEALP